MIPKSCLEVFQAEVHQSLSGAFLFFLFFKYLVNLGLFTWALLFIEVKLLSSVIHTTDFFGLIIC